MERLRRMGEHYARVQREQREQWGERPDKLSWDALCQQESAAHPTAARKLSGHPIFMSRQLAILKECNGDDRHGHWRLFDPKDTLMALRPEDAMHIPLLRVDKAGVVVDWNRSMCDLTGVSKQQVVGKAYADVLEEWIPHLSEEYKEAAVEWLKKEENETSEYDEEGCREDLLFPLPLPLRYDPSFKYVSGRNMHHDEYVELLVTRVDNLTEVYPQFASADGVPQYGKKDDDEWGWFFDTSRWVGGVEFTLRRKQFVPSLQMLCKELSPKNVVDEHGFFDLDIAAAAAAASSKTSESGGEQDVYEVIANYIRTCDRVGMKYMLEVLYNVRRACCNDGRLKTVLFSEDWSTNPATEEIHKSVLNALDGFAHIVQSVEKGTLKWALNSKETEFNLETLDTETKNVACSGLLGGGGSSKRFLQAVQWRKQASRQGAWLTFLSFLKPVILENREYARFLCKASDSCLKMEAPHKKLLTLKIEGVERSHGSYQEEKFKAWAVVQVPATLNFFQLHRVVCQTMNCSPDTTRETHEWTVPNLASDGERTVTDDDCQTIQIGERYFVENGRREDYGWDANTMLTPFSKGAVLRQRVSRTGAFFDQTMPLVLEKDYAGCLKRYRGVGKIVACIHSTSIGSVFYQTGTTALLQDGMCKYMTKYKLTCVRSDHFTGPLPTNPNINVMQPKCLRGKPEKGEGGEHGWSVAKANKQLELDRGCLRRILCGSGPSAITQMPWCMTRRTNDDADIPFPFATQLKGLDSRPMFLHGEPPLPGSDDYETYVSTLDGRIDSRFRQEHVVGAYEGFAVPFHYGKPGCGPRNGGLNYDSDDTNGKPDADCIGVVWSREVDEETKRVDSLQRKKAKANFAKKRKATTISMGKGP